MFDVVEFYFNISVFRSNALLISFPCLMGRPFMC